jgi:1L-myo-inositol 1-phosphate cytidylyltransferase
MGNVSEAVILIAGQGSRLRQGYGGQARLRGADTALLKPMVPVLGRPLMSYTLEGLRSAGIKTVHFVVGYEGERMIAEITQLIPSDMRGFFIENRDWRKQNGISLLAAASHVREPFLLTMGDHLFDDPIYERLLNDFDSTLLSVTIDRKLDSIFDLDDAMKVQTRKRRITAIGKDLQEYDAVDIGLFVCSLEIFAYLERAKSADYRNDCSLSDGIRLMAQDDKVRAIDIGDSWWQDVDTPRMLKHAEEQMSSGRVAKIGRYSWPRVAS